MNQQSTQEGENQYGDNDQQYNSMIDQVSKSVRDSKDSGVKRNKQTPKKNQYMKNTYENNA